MSGALYTRTAATKGSYRGITGTLGGKRACLDRIGMYTLDALER